MSAAVWLAGSALLVAEVAAVAAVAVVVRGRLVPGWRGAPARLAECVLGVAWVQAVGCLLGAIGLLRALPVAVVLLAAGLAAGSRVARARPPAARGRHAAAAGAPAGGDLPAAPDRLALGVAALASAVVVARWCGQTAAAWRRGMYDGDTLWYHAPFAARFVETGWVTRIHVVSDEPLVSFFPAASELLHALVALPFGAEVLSPVLNLGWLALALLAGWCVGRPAGVPAAGLAGVALVAGTPVLVLTQAGTARNDIVGLALLLAATALLLQPERSAGSVAIGGLAVGLALAVKVSLLAPAGLLLAAGAVALLRPRPRLAAAWVGAAVPLGAFWYLRNWVRLGNPLPWFSVELGPLSFRSPPLPQAAVGDSALLQRLDEPGWWSTMLRPALALGLGGWWLLVLLAALVALVAGAAAAVRAVRPADGAHLLPAGVVAASTLAAAAYVATPNSGPLPVGEVLAATLTALNLRYLLPGLLLVLCAVAPLALARSGVVALRAWCVVLGVVTVRSAWSGPLGDTGEWRAQPGDLVAGAAVAAAVTAVVAATLAMRRRIPAGRATALASAVAGVLLVAAGLPVIDRYLDRRWTEPAPFDAAELWPLGRELAGARIGVVGDFFQYPYAGPGLDNAVQYIAVPERDGGVRDASTCEEWLTALAGARVDVVVATRQLFDGGDADGPIEWTARDPAASVLRTSPSGGTAFRIDGTPTPDSC